MTAGAVAVLVALGLGACGSDDAATDDTTTTTAPTTVVETTVEETSTTTTTTTTTTAPETTTSTTTTTTTTAPPSTTAPATYPVVCGSLPREDPNVVGDGGVRITGPGVDCEEAMRIVGRYATDPTLAPPEGSSAYQEVERWTCWSDTFPTETRAYGGCELTDGTPEPRIELT